MSPAKQTICTNYNARTTRGAISFPLESRIHCCTIIQCLTGTLDWRIQIIKNNWNCSNENQNSLQQTRQHVTRACNSTRAKTKARDKTSVNILLVRAHKTPVCPRLSALHRLAQRSGTRECTALVLSFSSPPESQYTPLSRSEFIRTQLNRRARINKTSNY